MTSSCNRRRFLSGAAAIAGAVIWPWPAAGQRGNKLKLILLGTAGGPRPRKAWAAGLRTRVDAWGPPPLERMTGQFFDLNAYDMATRIADEGRVPLVPLLHVHELNEGGLVLQDENVKVTAALVHHPPVVPAFAYRFDAPDRSIVISGDTAPSDNGSRRTPLRAAAEVERSAAR
jgi:hypothetical protein